MIATLSKSVCHRRKLKVRGTTNNNVIDVTLLNKVNCLHDIPKFSVRSIYIHLIYVKGEWQIHSTFSWSDIYGKSVAFIRNFIEFGIFDDEFHLTILNFELGDFTMRRIISLNYEKC